MTVETATYIGDLNPNYPATGDAKSEGDNHLRLIKSTLQASFPNLGSVPMTATAAQLNAVVSSAGVLSVGTSTTSVTIGTGSKSFTTQTGLGFAAGQSARIQDNANLANYMLGTISSYTTATGAIVITVTDTGGSGTIADWSISLNLTVDMPRRAVTSTDTIVASDHGGIVDCSGTFTLSVTSSGTLGTGFFCYVRQGSGVLTIDPTETIDGSSTATMYENEVRLIHCDGSVFRSVVLREPLGVFHLQDQKTSGTAGQTIGSTTTWTKRDLQTTVKNSITGASVASSVITLPAGSYRVSGEFSGVSVASAVGVTQLRLRNTSDGSTTALAVQTSVSSNSVSVPLILSSEFTISASKNFEVQMYVTSAAGAVGNAASSGEVEVYGSIRFERV